jgi:hypothetical protein
MTSVGVCIEDDEYSVGSDAETVVTGNLGGLGGGPTRIQMIRVLCLNLSSLSKILLFGF